MALAEVLGEATASPAELQLRAPWAKRGFDLVLGLPLCLTAIPVILVLAVILAVQHRSNPTFVHERIGRGGRRIAIPKLRTLSAVTHPYADKTVVNIEALHGLSRFLRRTHLDELPQLFLVPLGRLSLVGPRPRMVAEAEEHGDEEYESVRTSVHQGCTGLWQVSGETGRVSDHPEYDLFYVEQRTLRLDAWILWRTLRQAVGGRGADLTDIPTWALRRPELAFADAA